MTKNVNIKPYLYQLRRGSGWLFALATVETLLLSAVNLFISWLLQLSFDMIAGVDTGFSLMQITVMALGCLLLDGAVFGCEYLTKPRLLSKGIAQYQEYVFSQICRKGIAAFAGEDTALYLSALSNDTSVIGNQYLGNFFVIADQVFIFFGALTMMFCYSPLLTVISIVLSLIPLIASVSTGNLAAKAEKALSDTSESYMNTLKDSLSGFSVIKSFRAEAQVCQLFAGKMQELAEAKCRRGKVNVLIQMISSCSGFFLQFGVFLIGAYLAMTDSALTSGVVLVFVQLMNFVITPIAVIPRALAERKAARALIEKTAAALEANIPREGGLECPDLEQGIALQNLSFSYEPEKPVLRELQVTFEKGRSYAIVGASGSGKSTLLNLLMASSGNYTGSISIDGAELRRIRPESLYDKIAMVEQNVFVFNASIQDNITMFADFSQEDRNRAVRLSGLEGLIREKGEGYLCGENGNALSGGEKQRISIARSLLKRSQVLLVDEATAALDAQTAFSVTNAILDIQDLTRIVVTHALDGALLSRFDCILILKNGKIEEMGSFDELMSRRGYFYSLYTVSQ